MHLTESVLLLSHIALSMLQVKELQALKQQLEDEVQIPQLQPLRDDTERLDQLLEALQHLQVRPACGGAVVRDLMVLCTWLVVPSAAVEKRITQDASMHPAIVCFYAELVTHAIAPGVQNAHMQMLRKDMRQMDLELLGLKLQLRMGDEYKGSPLESALKRLRSLHKLVEDGKRLPSAAWVQLDEDLKLVVSSVQQQQKLEQQLDVNIQKYEQMMFKRLAQLGQAG